MKSKKNGGVMVFLLSFSLEGGRTVTRTPSGRVRERFIVLSSNF